MNEARDYHGENKEPSDQEIARETAEKIRAYLERPLPKIDQANDYVSNIILSAIQASKEGDFMTKHRSRGSSTATRQATRIDAPYLLFSLSLAGRPIIEYLEGMSKAIKRVNRLRSLNRKAILYKRFDTNLRCLYPKRKRKKNKQHENKTNNCG
jgi:hypothetical protein